MSMNQTGLEMDWTADRIQDLRRRLRLSQTDFGKRLNVRQATISDWERGKHPPTGAAVKLLELLDREAKNGVGHS